MRREYSEEFKRRAVEMAKTQCASRVAAELGCDRTRIRHWAAEFGEEIVIKHRRPWPDKHVDKLFHMAGYWSLQEIAKSVGRTPEATLAKMHSLGLRTANMKNRLSRSDIDFICDHWTTMTCKQISEKIGHTYSAVYCTAKRIGLI